MTNKLKIIFSPSAIELKDSLLQPEPAIKFIPEWYKKISRFYKNNTISSLNPINDRGTDGSASSTKLCMPFFDAITSGYIYRLDTDVEVSLDDNGKPILNWGGDVMVCDKRLMIDVAVPYQHHPVHFGFKMHWYYETPPGYSLLITHPMNRHDLPFTVLSGIVDSDIWGLPVFISFFVKRNFVGIIPKGTPLFQMIPIKRDEWEMEIDYSVKKHLINKVDEERRRSKIFAYYKSHAWRRKKYE
jgi:hypothetical protein